ncbi:hypothetical protein AQS8620_03134 [Aquimixticola soesokkakensis]|uniref:Copper chaperone PCu(A)C n=1 Tax=Aquimixticola soesokkakensis TaxID=1519096 RepID=A0A1Y5TMR7_9RHOB|nr:copper chaperone PCu(A)C [Aquimixticola soesokkakensis]SLN67239.1 hypothetical protein AQS8620_03134 [Aquimixticola soesokkakensis]
MSLKFPLLAAALACIALPAFADIVVENPYFRTSGAMATSGAAFMVLHNTGETADRLIAARSDLSSRVELHTHLAGDNGVMRMLEVEDGFAVAPQARHELARGGDHVMFLGLDRRVAEGDIVTVTLTFEQAGDVVVEVPVRLDAPVGSAPAADMGHGAMDHGAMDHGAMDDGAMDHSDTEQGGAGHTH